MPLKKTAFVCLALCLTGLLGVMARPAIATEDGWILFKSPSGLFESVLPEENLKDDMISMRMNQHVLVFFGNTTSLIDQRPYKDEIKTHTISVKQTLGTPFTPEERGTLIRQELDIFTDHYKAKKGKVIEIKDDIWQSGFPGGEVYMDYQDPEFGLQYVRARIFVTDVSKMMQVLTAPGSAMNTYKTRDYFNLFVMHEGYAFEQGKMIDSWKNYNSPLGIFSVSLPPKAFPYVPEDAKVENGKTAERIFIRFFDPIWNENIIYNVHGYVLDRDLSYDNVVELLQQRHVLKHRFTGDKVQFRRLMNGKIPVVEVEYKMTPPEGYEYVTNVRLRAQFYKNYVMVNEVMASNRLLNSPLINVLMLQGNFHPQMAKKGGAAPSTTPAPVPGKLILKKTK
jgi:hypothetical protein